MKKKQPRLVNITFQASPSHKVLSWDETPIVYVLKAVPVTKDTLEISNAISAVLGFVVVRSARLFLDDEINSKVACRYNGGYHLAKPF